MSRRSRVGRPSPRPVVRVDDSLCDATGEHPESFLRSDRFLLPLFLALLWTLMVSLCNGPGITLEESDVSFDAAHGTAKAVQTFFDGAFRGRPVRAFKALTSDPVWQFHAGVPALPRLVQGKGLIFFGGFLREPVSIRAGSAFLWVLMLLVLFLLAFEAYGRPAAWAAMGLALAVPRLFAHGLVAGSESSLLFTWLAAVWVYLRCFERRWPDWAFGLAMGLAFMSKFPSLGVLIALSLWGLFQRPGRAATLFLWGLGFGFAVFVAFQPLYWNGTWHHLDAYLHFNLQSFPGKCHFLGRTYAGEGPWFYAPFLLAVTLPVPVLVCSLAGMVRAVAVRKRLPLLFVGLALFPLWVTLSSAPCDGERLFIQAYPFWVLGAAGGLSLLWIWKPSIRNATMVLVFLLAAGTLLCSHPHYLATYNALVGGPAGAERRGIEGTFWQDPVTGDMIKALNREVPLSGKVQILGMASGALGYQQHIGRLRKDIGFTLTREKGVTHLLMVRHLGSVDPAFYRRARPVYEVKFQGASLVKLVKAGS